MSLEVLPLFPLEVVLFPGMPLPLHIFEPRYQLMIRHCREERREFGVILARKEGLVRVGCSAEIVKVVKEYEDGRSDILTVGRRRFRLEQVFDELPHLQGRVEPLPDEEPAPSDPASSRRLLELYDEAFGLLYGRQPGVAEAGGELSLSFRIATELPFDLEARQQLLELLSEAERQQVLAARLEAWVPQLKHARRLKQKAAGNGRGR